MFVRNVAGEYEISEVGEGGAAEGSGLVNIGDVLVDLPALAQPLPPSLRRS